MKYVFYIIFGGLLVIGLIAALAMGLLVRLSRPDSATATAVPDTQVTFNGISFNIPVGLGGRTSNEVIQSQDSYAQLWPSHTRSILGNYPLTDTVYQPQIQVFLTQDYAQMSPDAAAVIDDLRTTLQSQAWSATDPLPYLPLTRTAAQTFHTQENFLTFINGSGLRYVTLYSQAAFPVQKLSQLELLYTFQGLSGDGKYYVSVTMPIRLDYVTVSETDASPFPEDGIPFNWDNPDPAQYPEYLAQAVAMINHPNNPINPSLEMLDALVQSIALGVEQ